MSGAYDPSTRFCFLTEARNSSAFPRPKTFCTSIAQRTCLQGPKLLLTFYCTVSRPHFRAQHLNIHRIHRRLRFTPPYIFCRPPTSPTQIHRYFYYYLEEEDRRMRTITRVEWMRLDGWMGVNLLSLILLFDVYSASVLHKNIVEWR